MTGKREVTGGGGLHPPGAPITEAELRALEPVLFRFALRATRDVEASRDLAQDTLLTAVSSASRFGGRSTLRTWVVGILAHKIFDAFRSAQTVPLDGDADAVLLETASTEDVERVVIARQELSRVEQALATLPARERLALLLTDVEGLERAEVCSALGVTPTHLRVVLHRGRNRLRRILEDHR